MFLYSLSCVRCFSIAVSRKALRFRHTQALIDKACHLFEQEGVVCQSIRLVDHTIPFGMQARVSDDDAWPTIFANVMNADIVVIATPIWLGEKSSVASLAIERLYASSGDKNTQGQYIYYNKVGGVLATGNEDGGKEALPRPYLCTTTYRLYHTASSRCLLGR